MSKGGFSPALFCCDFNVIVLIKNRVRLKKYQLFLDIDFVKKIAYTGGFGIGMPEILTLTETSRSRTEGQWKAKLSKAFYEKPTLTVAKELLGKYLVVRHPNRILSGRIVEVEAYVGEDDPACHANAGLTDRNHIMYGLGGFAYIYVIYGMYHCLNFVTEQEGFPAAVLIRGVEPKEGVEEMKRRRDTSSVSGLTNGPGKICQAFGIDKSFYGMDLTGTRVWVEDRGEKRPPLAQSARIGVTAGKDKLWRFYVPKSPGVSKDKKR